MAFLLFNLLIPKGFLLFCFILFFWPASSGHCIPLPDSVTQLLDTLSP